MASECLGAGETELLEEGDLGVGCCVRVAVECCCCLVGWFGRGPRGICKRDDAMGGRTLEGIEVHLCSLRPVGCEGNWSDRSSPQLTEKEPR